MSETINNSKAEGSKMVTFTPTASTLNHDAPAFRPVTPPNSVVPEPITSDAYAPVLRPPFTLNPDAPPFRLHPDKRSLFITLSNGFPLTESQICNFFNSCYPSSVEDVHVHKVGRKSGLFGKVTFKRADIPNHVLGIHEKVCVYVDGFPLHCKRFVSKGTGESSNAANTASNNPYDGGDE